MYKKVVAYLLLLLFAALALANSIPFGDYGSGLFNGMLMLLFTGIFGFIFLIMLVKNIDNYYRYKVRFDWIPVAIMAVFVLLLTLTVKTNGNKFWTSVVLEADTNNPHQPHDGHLVLYKNHSFVGTEVFADFAMHYSGNYTISNDTVRLDREDLPKKTGGLLTTRYYLDSKNNKLVPLDTLFSPLFLMQ